MPQQTNLNVSPYFDDFDATKNYHKVLFKPGYPVQARELTTLQSILQNQIEEFGNHIFKEGSVVIPGQISYNNSFFAVKIESSYLGIDVNQYVSNLVNYTIIGDTTKVEAKIVYVLPQNEEGNEYITLYVNYLASGLQEQKVFSDKEKLILQQTFSKDAILIQQGEGFATTSADCSAIGSSVVLSEGVYFLRGNFVQVSDQTLILDPYSNQPSYKVGLDIIEEVITSYEDESLNDNAQGFSNYAAPGADRFKISAFLSKKELTDTNTDNFVGLLEVNQGALIKNVSPNPQYEVLRTELARRTADESGSYYVTPFTITPRESLNDYLGNNGIYDSNQVTYNNNVPSDDLATYKISPGKAYVNGYEVNIISTSFLDFKKPRTTKTASNANIQYLTGSTYTVNRVYGAPNLNLASPFIVSLRDERVGVTSATGSGKEIGLARVYDFALESGSYNTSNKNLNEWDLALFDLDTYTEISLNQPITLSTPVHIKGKASGATGYLRFDVNNAGIMTAYGVKGSFASGEKFIFNGVETSSRVSTAVTEYTPSDVKSLSQISGITTVFSADIIPSIAYPIGIASITARSATGISSITIPTSVDFVFTNNVKENTLVGYTIGGSTVPTFSRVVTISDKVITVTGVTTVTGICEGSPPASASNVTDLAILTSNFQASPDNTLYTRLPKSHIKSVDLTESNLTIRKEFSVSITSNQTNTVTADTNEFFLPFDEERYVLTRSDGAFEVLTSDKLVFDSESRQLTIYGLGTNDANCRLIATLKKINVTAKSKNKNRISTLIVNNSKLSSSGIGTTTLNDGLTYGSYPYGTRVQDEEISLNVPEVTKLYAILESSDTSDPIAPAITFAQLNGPTAKTNDLLVGEQFIGKTSQAVGIYVGKNNDLKIDFIYLNERLFQEGEIVTFKDSGITATIQTISLGSPNIIRNYTLEYGQNDTILNYSKVIRNRSAKEPTRKLKFIFESASFLSSDQGDITTVNSYDLFNYCDVPLINNITSSSDVLDIRPRVSNYTTTSGSRSPFEFLSRSFSTTGNSGKNILASDESIVLSYSHYLPRIDRLFLTKDGVFQLNAGEPSENPQMPTEVSDAIEVATITLPPYVCDVSAISVNYLQHKRYQMKDISRLEDRIKNLESFTTLNLLEIQTESIRVKDSAGLDRFKSGFFVDNFTNTDYQNKSNRIKNSIDVKNAELRPSPYTTALDLLIGSKSLIGIGQSVDPNADIRYVTDLVGNNIRRTGQTVTLDYDDVVKVSNPYATRSISVTPYLVAKYIGTVDLSPDSDTWVDQVRLEPRRVVIDTFTQTKAQLVAEGWDPQTGYSPISWGAWETNWVGTNVSLSQSTSWNGYYGWGWYGWGGWGQTTTTTATVTTKLGQQRTGVRKKLEEQVDVSSFGDYLVSSELSHFMRSRNVEFTGKKFRPFSQVYAFFDGQDVNKFIVPKLLEITMQSGVFQVGETVLGYIPSSSTANNLVPGTTLIEIAFRVAQTNHKYGPFNKPTDVYVRNPYDQLNTTAVASSYSSTSTLLNVDTASLAEQATGSFYGNVAPGLLLKGLTSGAEAVISSVKLVTDHVGTVIGSFLIPNPNLPTSPVFETGTKTFRLTSSPTDVRGAIDSITDTNAEANYYAQGLVNSVQETIVSVKTPKYTSETFTENRTLSSSSSSTASSNTYGWGWGWGRYGRGWYCGRHDPLAQSFYVEEEYGIFVTKVDIYFRTKDPEVPVEVQLRPMSMGLPKEEAYPFSVVTIDPDKINTSEDGTVKTTVVFPSPIYLQGLHEHAIVLLSQSPEYTVWISRLGEVDITTVTGPESQQVIVNEQPLLGSLFKSQNGSTWDPSQYEDLKFTLYKAKFNVNENGDINFYNPNLDVGNKQSANLVVDPFEFNSRTIRVGLGTTVTDTGLILGNTIIQNNSNATGKYVGSAGSAFGPLTITNSGIGYSNGSYPGTALVNVTGSGQNATANITIANNVATGATVTVGGSGYRVGDVLTVNSLGGSTLGQNLRLTVASISATNELILDNIQGEFKVGTGSTIGYIAVGIGSTNLNGTAGNVTASYVTVDSEEKDGLYIKVNHKNHGMYALNNDVIITDAYPDSLPTFLTVDIAKDSTAAISLSDMIIDPTTGISIFSKFENVSVSSTNPGYVMIGQEIIAYEGVSGNTLTGITRSIDQTKSFSYGVGSPVFKYELNGISLRRINRTHTLQDAVDLDRSIDLDYYYLKIDSSQAGKTDALPYGQVDRSVGTSFPLLYIKETKSAGGPNIYATQNIPFEIVRTNIQTLQVPNTNITASMKTTSGSSVDGSEESYTDQGYQPISLDSNTYFPTPRIVASKVNESTKLTSSAFPGNKSLTLNMKLASSVEDVSPMIDLDRVSVIFTSNRVNNPIENYATDFRVSSLRDDPSAFVYASNAISLEVPASSIKIITSTYVNQLSDVRALYAIMKDPNEDPVYYPFPGYNNLTNTGSIIDKANNDGLSDTKVSKTDNVNDLSESLDYREYQFSVNNLPEFRYFSIKLIGSSQDQAHPPRFKELRVIALA